MSITKKARAALLVMLFSISILPGCGKNKNAEPGVGIGVAPVGVATVGIGGTGGCYNLYGTSAAVTLTFAGTNNSQFAGSFAGTLRPASVVGVGGYSRSTQAPGGGADSVTIGQSAPGQMVAVVTLSANTVLASQYYFGGQICNLTVNALGQQNGTLGGPVGINGLPSYMNL